MKYAWLVAWAIGASACAGQAPDLVLVNGRIFTADASHPWAEALAVRGERIVAVGDTAEILTMGGGSAERIDAGGRLVVPGFNDAHLTLDGGAEALGAYAALAPVQGVTSVQLFCQDVPVDSMVRRLLATSTPVRWRVVRMPVPDAQGGTRDSAPHLPPQPTPRMDVRGMGFVMGAADDARLKQAVQWAFGTEDALAIRATDAAAQQSYLTLLSTTGVPEVWRAKRPRIERAGPLASPQIEQARRAGVVFVQSPGGGEIPLRSLSDAQLPIALATDGAPSVLAVLAWATAAANPERVSREQAVTAFTAGGAFAEFTDRDKGRLAPGALADLAVFAEDLLTIPVERLGETRAALTMIGGRVVHDVSRP